MVRNVLAVGVSVVALVVVSLVLAALFRAQVRHYDRAVARDLLDDWKLQLELLDPRERERALQAPPADVVAAMAALPSPGLRDDWNMLPAASSRPAGRRDSPGAGSTVDRDDRFGRA